MRGLEGCLAIVVDVFWTTWPGTVDGHKAIAGTFAQSGFEADFARSVAYCSFIDLVDNKEKRQMIPLLLKSTLNTASRSIEVRQWPVGTMSIDPSFHRNLRDGFEGIG